MKPKLIPASLATAVDPCRYLLHQLGYTSLTMGRMTSPLPPSAKVCHTVHVGWGAAQRERERERARALVCCKAHGVHCDTQLKNHLAAFDAMPALEVAKVAVLYTAGKQVSVELLAGVCHVHSNK